MDVGILEILNFVIPLKDVHVLDNSVLYKIVIIQFNIDYGDERTDAKEIIAQKVIFIKYPGLFI